MIEIALVPAVIAVGVPTDVIVRLCNTYSSPCSNIIVNFEMRSGVELQWGRGSISIDRLDAAEVRTHEIVLYGRQVGRHLIALRNFSYRGPSSSHQRPGLKGLTLEVSADRTLTQPSTRFRPPPPHLDEPHPGPPNKARARDRKRITQVFNVGGDMTHYGDVSGHGNVIGQDNKVENSMNDSFHGITTNQGTDLGQVLAQLRDHIERAPVKDDTREHALAQLTMLSDEAVKPEPNKRNLGYYWRAIQLAVPTVLELTKAADQITHLVT